jgi:hypothetical protein
MNKLSERIIRKFAIRPWPAGGFVFPMGREVRLFGDAATYIKGSGGLGGMCWVERMEDAIDIVSKYPHDVKVSVSIHELMELIEGS